MDIKGRDRTLTNRQIRTIPLLITSRTLVEGAERAGIARSTLYRWLEDPVFKDELQRQVRENIDHALIELKSSLGEAVGVLKSLLGSENDHVRLRAAIEIHAYAAKFIELEDLEERLETLEVKYSNNRGY